MSGPELALETQLLLQEVTQATQRVAVDRVLDDAGTPPASDLEAAQSALIAKLRRKKEASRAQQQQLNQRRYGPAPLAPQQLFSPRKTRALNLPVAAAATAGGRKKQDMLARLRSQAIEQGAQNMAKVFGYASYEEQLKHLNKIEKMKILEDEMKNQQDEEKQQRQQQRQQEQQVDGEEQEEDEDEDGDAQEEEHGNEDAEPEGEADAEGAGAETEAAEAAPEDNVSMEDKTAPRKASLIKSAKDGAEQEEQETVKVVRRRNRVLKQDVDEEDGNEADSEQDDQEGDDADADMEDATAAVEATNEQEVDAEKDDGESEAAKPTKPKDKAAGYRQMLQAEAMQNRKRKRLIKGRGGDNFVESEAEEDEEEDVLKIGGLGDFGFGVTLAKTQESKEAEEERNALKLREDDLDHIVDDISDDERAQEQDLDEMFRREQEDQDRQQVKEVMRNVKEGFGRNRRAFSGLHSGSEARGRFNLDELVAADGSKFEAARLGLLESDEELSEGEDGKKKNVNADGEDVDEEEEEEDEEAEMERMLRERFMNQPKIYVTSSESGSDNEDENETKKDNGPDGDEVESDEERERQQMKLFSERARINRRMQRMKDLQRQIALENNEADPTAKSNAAMPNLLLEEDEDSQELMHLLNRTDVDAKPSSQTAPSNAQKKSRTDRPRPQFGRFNSYGGMTSTSRSSSSFSRVIGHCKLFSANSSGGAASSSKGFVFTSFSSDKAEGGADENAAPNNDDAMPSARPELGKSKSWGGAKAATKRRGAPGAGNAAAAKKKRKNGGGLFSVLSSYQCYAAGSPNASDDPEIGPSETSQFAPLGGAARHRIDSCDAGGGANGSCIPPVSMSSLHSRSDETHRRSSSNSSSSSSSSFSSSSSASSSSSLDGAVGSDPISGPYRVGNSDGDTCSYHALQDGASCRRPRTCYECLNSDVAGVSDGCLLAPSGFCEDMSSYEATLDYRRNTTGEDLGLTGWYNYFPSVNSSYCEASDDACELCDELVNNGSLGQASHWSFEAQNVSTEVERQFCLGTDGCVCVMACETDNWETNMPAECDTNGSNSGNSNKSSTDATSYSTMLIIYLVLQVVLLAVFMYRRGLCRRMTPQRPPVRAEGPYNNVNAISSPSNRLRLSGWRKMQNTLIEREKKQRAMQQPQYMASPRVEGATSQVEATTATPAARPLSPQVSARNNDTARAAYTQVEDDQDVAADARDRNDSLPTCQERASVSSDVVVVEGPYEDRIGTRGVRAQSTVAMLEAHRDAV
ncbi:unnamed protein product [Phytophthora fragariaefolia]|uniref:Unnamed protein product n=1 Tax=Phytophthora fragariaefolia TaxID=1490495 RepID=A0A9W6XF41_9STRA|nr:unnamed protein product [Phytophthora fragariaefolia]